MTYDLVHFMRFIYGEFLPIERRQNYIAAVKDVEERCNSRMEAGVNLDPVVTYLDGCDKIDEAESDPISLDTELA